MKSLKNGKNRNGETRLIGQAGVWEVASQLALRGMYPLFPGIDKGYDLVLENGLRIQVKTATLKIYGGDKRYLAYCFDCRGKKWNPELKQVRPSGHKDYATRADYYVLWGVDENRFWVIPTSEVKGNIWFPRRDYLNPNAMLGRAQRNYQRAIERLQRTESRWDLLDVTSVNDIIETAVLEEGELPCRSK